MRKLILLVIFTLSITLCGCEGVLYLLFMPDDDDEIVLPTTDPARVTNPNPAHEATDVPVTTDLSWADAVRATFYEVYFGTVESAVTNATSGSPEFKGPVTPPSYDPGLLSYSTLYYWRIDSCNATSDTKGHVWQFTTEDAPTSPPAKVTGPDPANGAVNVAVDKTLLWSAATGATSYDVYFGTNATNVSNATTASSEFMGAQTNTNYSPGTMLTSTTYYWRIDSANSFGTTKGDLWTFSTAPPPPVAEFSADSTIGTTTTEFTFTDGSSGSITSWSWDFGSGASPPTASTQGPHIVTYNTAGTKTVSLTVIGPGGSDSETKADYIMVTSVPAPIADFTANPTSGTVPLVVTFTDTSTGSTTGWDWDFGSGASPPISNTQGPHDVTYNTTGLKTVSLTVFGPGGNDTETKVDHITVTVAPMSTVYVATTGNDTTGDGSLGTPYQTIQKGIDSVIAGCTVLVLDGTYTGTGNKDLDFGGKDIVLKSTGGAENCIIDCEASGRGFYFHSGETNAAIVEGLTIKNGFAANACGGGILCNNSSSPIILNCIILNSKAEFVSGSDTGYGGGICCWNADAQIMNCHFSGNTADVDGGGAFVRDSSDSRIVACMFKDNNATRWGGGFCLRGDSEAVNCLAYNNTADGGAGVYLYLSDAILANCTITGNTATSEAGGVGCNNGTQNLNNSILWGNSASTGNEIYTYEASSNLILDTCNFADGSQDIEGNGTVTPSNCITLDPQFVNATAQNYRLCGGSPCIDTGDDGLIPPGVTTDLDGNPRVIGAAVDMGCYEGGWYIVPDSYGTIQSAIDASTDGDTVVVMDGTYTGAGNKDLDFGGRAITLCSENGAASCTIDCEDSGRGFYFHSGEGNDSIVEGFTITNGYATGSWPDSCGGGILCYNGSCPTICRCKVTDNFGGSGGGIYCYTNSPMRIIDCEITNNTVNGGGGGIVCYGNSGALISNCIIASNTQESYGGILSNASDTQIINCLIVNNVTNGSSEGAGAGVGCVGSGTSSNVLIANCTIANNTASTGQNGGGIYCGDNTGVTLNNCIIWGNSTGGSGHQLYAWSSSLGVALNYCDYSNGANDIGGTGTVTPTACIQQNPLFVNAAGGNYRLSGSSPCIDAGSNALVPPGITTDLDGNPRMRESAVDIGCYEGGYTYQIVNISSGTVTYAETIPDLLSNDDYKTTKLVLKRISAGTFQMGDQVGGGEVYEVPVHTVNITKPFYIGVFEVTQKQWHEIQGDWPSYFTTDPEKRPVEQVSWDDINGAGGFLESLNTLTTGLDFRLPTEAEWEYCCKAGTTTDWYFGSTEDGAYMWYNVNAGGETHEVGTKLPNSWGLYDMHGNVMEWCEDWFDGSYYQYCVDNTITDDPQGPIGPYSHHPDRGGSWGYTAWDCRSAMRGRNAPTFSSYRGGFRVSCSTQ